MSGDDPFRDDHDAALARADALERENKRLRAELAKQKPKPDDSNDDAPPSSGWSRRRKIVTITGCILGVLGFIALDSYPDCHAQHDHERWERERDELAANVARWQALVSLDRCLRDSEARRDWMSHETVATIDPRQASVHTREIEDLASFYGASCAEQARLLRVDFTLPASARTAIATWLDAEQATAKAGAALASYLGGDWREDQYASAPARWAQLVTASDRRATARAAVRRAAVAPVRAAIRAVQAEHATRVGRDTAWWQVELALAFEDTLDAIADERARGGSGSAAARAGARTMFELATNAPANLRHDVNRSSQLEQMTQGYAPPLPDNPLWPQVDDFHPNTLFPPLRPEPELPTGD